MRKFNFNDIEAPRMHVTLRSGLELQLEIPCVSLIEKLRTGTKMLAQSVTENNLSDLGRYYDLAAELLSCNTSNVQISSYDMEHKEHIHIDDLVDFFTAYIEFVNEAGSAKN